MSTDTTGAVVLVLLAATLISTGVAWTTVGRPVWAPAAAGLLTATLVTAAAAPALEIGGRGGTTLLVVLAGATAVVGGGPITCWVFDSVDRHDAEVEADPHSLEAAGTVLRGGAWIGALERTAVFVSVVAAEPEGLAVALALKALGRYPELRSGASAGAAERFIIGTFTSVLWAVACAGLPRLV